MLSNSFEAVFDKTHSCRTNSKGKGLIRELNPNASVQSLQLISNGNDFVTYSNVVVKDMPDLTTRRTSMVKDSDCDGIQFVVDARGNEQLVLIELKSTFDTGKICNAYNQLIHSFLKLHSLFSLCEDYSLNQLHISFIVGCKCFKDKAQESSVYSKINDAMILKQNNFEEKFLGRLLNNKSISVKMSDFSDIQQINFHQDLKAKQITMRLCQTQKFSDTNINVIL